MGRFLKNNLWVMWSGGATYALFGFGLQNWQWWIFIVVMAILVAIKEY